MDDPQRFQHTIARILVEVEHSTTTRLFGVAGGGGGGGGRPQLARLCFVMCRVFFNLRLIGVAGGVDHRLQDCVL
jgi:hypothetical protein